jgi:hypothetical protein
VSAPPVLNLLRLGAGPGSHLLAGFSDNQTNRHVRSVQERQFLARLERARQGAGSGSGTPEARNAGPGARWGGAGGGDASDRLPLDPFCMRPIERLTPAATGNPLLSMFDPEKPSSRRPSLIGRALRRVAVFLVAICIGIAGTLAWQSPVSDPAKQQLASWARQQGWQSTSKTLAPETEKAVEQPSPPSQGPVRELPPPRPAAGTPVVAGAPTHEVLQQLEVIGRDLAAVRQNLEQLARDQKQLDGPLAVVLNGHSGITGR